MQARPDDAPKGLPPRWLFLDAVTQCAMALGSFLTLMPPTAAGLVPRPVQKQSTVRYLFFSVFGTPPRHLLSGIWATFLINLDVVFAHAAHSIRSGSKTRPETESTVRYLFFSVFGTPPRPLWIVIWATFLLNLGVVFETRI